MGFITMPYGWGEMNKVINKTFNILFKIEDLRQIWRDTTPMHELTLEQKEKVKKLLLEVKENVEFILRSLEQ